MNARITMLAILLLAQSASIEGLVKRVAHLREHEQPLYLLPIERE